MKWMKGAIAAAIGAVLVAGSSFAQTRNTQAAQQQMQQQMQQMQQQMTQVQNRTHELGLMLGNRMADAAQAQVREQYRQMIRMNEHLGVMAAQMKNASERCELMLQDREMLQDRQMEQEMERLRVHLRDMTGQIDSAVQSMERLSKRLNERSSEGM